MVDKPIKPQGLLSFIVCPTSPMRVDSKVGIILFQRFSTVYVSFYPHAAFQLQVQGLIRLRVYLKMGFLCVIYTVFD